MSSAADMNDEIDQVASAIRDAFTTSGDLSEIAIERLHTNLSNLVQSTNARLKHCDDLLRRGLRQEALQECEQEPELLSLVTRLDIPEWNAWSDYVRQYGLAPQPDLLIDVAAELNEAYSTAQSLDGLLRLHRLHSLARSPLHIRLGVLRSIAAKDPTNPAWREDLKAFEIARLKQVKTEFLESSGQGDLTAVSALRREVEDSNWLVPPAGALVDEITAGHNRLVAKASRAQLADLETVINAAFSAFDQVAAHAARARWNKVWPLAGLTSDCELALRIKPAFDWLDEEANQQVRQGEYDRDLAALENALDDESTQRHELVRLYSAIERYDEPVQARMQRRYDERLHSLDTAGRRKHGLILASGLCAVVIVTVIVGVFSFKQMRKSEIAATESAITQFIEKNEPEQAIEFYKNQVVAKPFLAEVPQIQSVVTQAQGQRKEEVDRRHHVDELLQQATDLALAPSWESAATASALVAEAKKLVRGEGEQVRLLTTEREVAKIVADLQSQMDSRFKKDVAEFVALAEAKANSPINEQIALVKDAQSLRDRQRVSTVALQASGVDVLIRKLQDRVKSISESQRRDEALRYIVDAIGRESAYQKALNNYLSVDAVSARATEFREVLDQDLVKLGQLSKWNVLVDEWNGLAFNSAADGESATQIIKEVQANYADFPGAKELIVIKPYIDSMASRQKADGSSIRGELREVLKDNVFNMKRVANQREGGFFYYLGEPTKSANGNVEIAQLLDSKDWGKVDLKKFSAGDFNDALSKTGSTSTPQKAFADRANALLAKDDVTYEYVVCGILHMLFTDKEMDPILKCRLLQVFFDRAAPGSSIVAEELAPFRAALESKYSLEDTNFLDLSDPQVATIRANIVDLLNRVPDSPKYVFANRIQPRVQKIMDGNARLPKLNWVGSLFRAQNGEWSVRSTGSAQPGTQLDVAVVDKSESGTPTFEKIGTLNGKEFRLLRPASELYREGRPVLLLTTTP
jgi:hypothetical protein